MASRTSLTQSLGGHRTVSFLATPDADEYPVIPLVPLLVAISFSEGLDASLFPSVTKTLETEENFDVNIVANLATVQLLFQAVAGPSWGVLASRGILSRKVILIICTFFQGLATLVMWMNLELYWILPWRAVNGIMLAGLRPICNSIVGDRFDDSIRGQYFGYVMSGMQLGAMSGTGFATSIAKREVFEGFLGWKVAFISIGLFTMALAPLVALFLRAPPVKVEDQKDTGGGRCSELQTLCKLFRRKTFAMLVFQGCFGLIPWRAFDFRNFFLETAGLDPDQTATASIVGGLGASVGSYLGGPIGDKLGAWWPLHGRVLTAEISVYGGIPVAYFSFMVMPASLGLNPFIYYCVLTGSLGLIATWTPAGTNSPVLCSLAKEDERALILSWQTSLEGSVGALGPIFFSLILRSLGYNKDCNDKESDFYKENPELCNNVEVAGYALFLSSCVPWAVCGLMYSTLHYTYPRDLASIRDEEAMETELGAING